MADARRGSSAEAALTGVWNVTVSRDGRPVLRDLTLLAGPGELLVVLGPSGSGKSTLLRTIAGLQPVDAGEVFVRGRRVTDQQPAERNIAMVFEDSTLVPFLDVARNMGWGLKLRNVDPAEAGRRVDDQAHRLRIGDLLHRLPDALSHGERGMVGIGHSLVAEPDVFLFDEPLAPLDAANRATVRRRIVEVVSALQATTFYVTHDQREAMAIADQVAVLYGGTVVQRDRPMALYHRPAELIVATLVGSPPIGLLPARMVSTNGMGAFEVGGRVLPLWGPLPPELLPHAGRQVVLGLRAEDVLAAADAGPDRVVLDGLVTAVEFAGRHSVVAITVETGSLEGAGTPAMDSLAVGATVRTLVPVAAGLHPGDHLPLAIDARTAHVFDALDGRALWHPARS